MDEEDLDVTDVPVAEPDNACEGQITVITTGEHLCSPWTEVLNGLSADSYEVLSFGLFEFYVHRL